MRRSLSMPDSALSSLSRFDFLAGSYEAWFSTGLGAFVGRREKDLLVALLRPRPDDTILEVGSGTGYFLRELARMGAYCVGIEPSKEMLAVAMARPARGVGYIRGRAESLPFKDASFDSLLYMTTLEFVQDAHAAIREATRVVQPDGRLVLGVLNADGAWARARWREGGLWRAAHFFRAEELEALLSPFGPIRLSYCVHVPPSAGWMPGPLMTLVDWLMRRLFPASGAIIGVQVKLGRPQ